MLIVFFNTKGTVHWEFVPAGVTVTSEFYCDVLWGAWEKMCGKKKTTVLGKTKLAVTPWQCTCVHLSQNNTAFDTKQHGSHPTPSVLSKSRLLWLYFVSQTKIKAERPLLWHHRRYHKRIRQMTSRKETLPMLLGLEEALELMHMLPRILFKGKAVICKKVRILIF